MSKVKKAIGKKILVRVYEAPRKGLIHMPGKTFQKNLTGMIVSVGPGVKDRTLEPGMIVLCDSQSAMPIETRVPGKPSEIHALVEESNILMRRHEKIMRPHGRRILMERINDEVLYGGIIVIPAAFTSADQSLFGVASLLGVENNKVIDYPIQAGEILRIQKWSINIKEIDIDGKYHLIVPVNEIAYKCDYDTMVMNYAKS